MQKVVYSSNNRRYLEIKFDTESDVYKFYKDGYGECWHDVPKQIVVNWAKDHGFDESQNLFDFVEEKFNAGLADSFDSYVEQTTRPTYIWISSDDMD